MNFRKAILNFFTLLNTVYLGLVIYIEFFMENLTKNSYEIYYDLWMYVFVGYCAILIFNFAMFGKVTLWNLRSKK